jgi:hypothetical protein
LPETTRLHLVDPVHGVDRDSEAFAGYGTRDRDYPAPAADVLDGLGAAIPRLQAPLPNAIIGKRLIKETPLVKTPSTSRRAKSAYRQTEHDHGADAKRKGEVVPRASDACARAEIHHRPPASGEAVD